jgi:hypothetical protein
MEERVRQPDTEHGDWYVLPPEAPPRPTYWPAVLALGIVFLLWGVAATFLISGVGLVLCALALAGWIGDLRHAQRSATQRAVE